MAKAPAATRRERPRMRATCSSIRPGMSAAGGRARSSKAAPISRGMRELAAWERKIAAMPRAMRRRYGRV